MVLDKIDIGGEFDLGHRLWIFLSYDRPKLRFLHHLSCVLLQEEFPFRRFSFFYGDERILFNDWGDISTLIVSYVG